MKLPNRVPMTNAQLTQSVFELYELIAGLQEVMRDQAQVVTKGLAAIDDVQARTARSIEELRRSLDDHFDGGKEPWQT